jgi:hypothetical protein
MACDFDKLGSRCMVRAGMLCLRFPLLLAVVSLLGCPPPVRPRTAPSQILEWTLGPQNLASPASPDVFLVLIPKGKLPPRPPAGPPPKPSGTKLSEGNEPAPLAEGLSECMRATSFLPAPQDDGRFFFVIDGAIHGLRPPDKKATRVEGMAAGMRINNLLAVRKASEGLEVLGSVHVEGKTEHEIHAIVVNASGIVRSGIAELRVEEPAELFALYTVPRCTADGKQCLKVSRDDVSTYIEQWSAVGGSGSAPLTLAKVDGAADATWAPTNDGSMYVLQSCP